MSTFTADSPMPIRKPLFDRINVRLIVFLGIISLPLVGVLAGLILYNGGIMHTAEGDMIDLKALGNFAFNAEHGTNKDIPPQWKSFDGKKVVLDGFMVTLASAGKGQREFQFVYDVQKCCFNGPPLIQERVFVRVPKGRNIASYGDKCRVVGTLHVNVEKSKEGTITSVFSMDVDKAWHPGFWSW